MRLFLLTFLFTGFLFMPAVQAQFSFSVVSDQRSSAGPEYDSLEYLRGAIEALRREGNGSFLISPGDLAPASSTDWTISQILGDDFQWYPVIGNHDLPGEGDELYLGENMEWIRAFDFDINGVETAPDIVRTGPSGCPETTYSLDYENAHFVILNVYCDEAGDTATTGDITDHLYQWLRDDLEDTSQSHIFVFGHEPAYPQPDRDNGRFRHATDSLNANTSHRNRFWTLLKDQDVVAYFHGHTHGFSAIRLDGVWQIDSGIARGIDDTGAPATAMRIDVGETVVLNVFRDSHDGLYDYRDIAYRETLQGPEDSRTISFQQGVSPTAAYKGASDTTLSENAPTTNYGGETYLFIDGDDPTGSGKDKVALLFWDISAIPAGSFINSVRITANITNPSGLPYHLFGLKREWQQASATWRLAKSGSDWQRDGAEGIEDRSSKLLAGLAAGSTGSCAFNLNASGIALVQSWVENPENNHGIVIAGTESSDGFDLLSSEATDPSSRPRLTISYLPGSIGGKPGLPWLHLLLRER